MLIIDVSIHVRPDDVDAFIAATRANARASLQEPGVIRFDFAQHKEDPTRFLLVEIYQTPADPAHHKGTAHYATWRETVEPMMAEPRKGTTYNAILP